MSEENKQSEEQKENATPSRTIKINYKGKEYDIEFPNTGGLMDIAVMKAQLSAGMYNQIQVSSAMSDNLARFSIDTIAHFSVLLPDFLKDLNVKTYSEMDLMDMKELVMIYIEEIFPWMTSWMKLLNNVDAK